MKPWARVYCLHRVARPYWMWVLHLGCGEYTVTSRHHGHDTAGYGSRYGAIRALKKCLKRMGLNGVKMFIQKG
jgi:hypothetical protein